MNAGGGAHMWREVWDETVSHIYKYTLSKHVPHLHRRALLMRTGGPLQLQRRKSRGSARCPSRTLTRSSRARKSISRRVRRSTSITSCRFSFNTSVLSSLRALAKRGWTNVEMLGVRTRIGVRRRLAPRGQRWPLCGIGCWICLATTTIMSCSRVHHHPHHPVLHQLYEPT